MLRRIAGHLRLVLLVVAVALLGNGCASLPANPARQETHTLGPAPCGELVETSLAVLGRHVPDESAFLLLEDNARALEWRLALIDHAIRALNYSILFGRTMKRDGCC
jgi:hypothetical protein